MGARDTQEDAGREQFRFFFALTVSERSAKSRSSTVAAGDGDAAL